MKYWVVRHDAKYSSCTCRCLATTAIHSLVQCLWAKDLYLLHIRSPCLTVHCEVRSSLKTTAQHFHVNVIWMELPSSKRYFPLNPSHVKAILNNASVSSEYRSKPPTTVTAVLEWKCLFNIAPLPSSPQSAPKSSSLHSTKLGSSGSSGKKIDHV